jgi:predicted dehydrogenase
MFRRFTRSEPSEVTALMGNHSWGLAVEDYSTVSLRSGAAVCTTETGYTFPGPKGVWDLRFCVRMHDHYVILRNDNMIEIYRTDTGEVRLVPTAASGNSYWYAAFVEESLRRFAAGLPPVSDLDDLVSAMGVVDAAYASNLSGGRALAPAR